MIRTRLRYTKNYIIMCCVLILNFEANNFLPNHERTPVEEMKAAEASGRFHYIPSSGESGEDLEMLNEETDKISGMYSLMFISKFKVWLCLEVSVGQLVTLLPVSSKLPPPPTIDPKKLDPEMLDDPDLDEELELDIANLNLDLDNIDTLLEKNIILGLFKLLYALKLLGKCLIAHLFLLFLFNLINQATTTT
uniref:(California timema) hypothetical protein n=1 Tax=Timema californicum TaxID=61474 RepID=A0A7R9IZT6_TIMCA|nr:unnamed protein product [Timema californicum]